MPENLNPSQARAGINLDNSISDLKPGELTFALNAVTSNFNGDSYKYQNEPGFILCAPLPKGFVLNGQHSITEENIIVVWILNEETSESEIGTISNCIYTKYINDDCIDLDVNFPIHKAFHRITPTGIEVYWTDGKSGRRYINLSQKPFLQTPDDNACGFIINENIIDCNRMNVQPNFNIPAIDVKSIDSGGNLEAGTYQFTAQYASADSEPYTSFYSVTNPLPIGNTSLITPDFNYVVGKSIELNISNIDVSGVYKFINVAVIKTVNLISTPELIGTYKIEENTLSLVYNGQKKDNIRLSIDDIFQKYPIYEKADDIFVVDDVLGWSNLTTNERLNYQNIWNNVHLQWQTHRIPLSEGYIKEITSEEKKGFFRDEIYALEGCFLLTNGHQTDRCHIPGRISIPSDLELIDNNDVVYSSDRCDVDNIQRTMERWKVYNTASMTDYEDGWKDGKQDDCYNGPYQFGEFAYWESSESYPCDEKLWGILAGEKIRHHKFPDSSVTHIHDNEGNIYPLGIKINVEELQMLIKSSSLTQKQKDEIVGFKILRADRINNKSVIARGLIHNVLKYSQSGNFTSGEDLAVSVQTQVGSLIDQATSLLKQGVLPVLNLLNRNDYKKTQDVITQLEYVKTIPVGTDEYKRNLKEADDKLKEVQANNYGDTTSAYLSGAESIIESLYDIEALDLTNSVTGISSSDNYYFPNYLYNDVTGDDPYLDNTIIDESSRERYVFHSPDTHFYQPYLGNVLKLETIESGNSEGHLREVQKHSKYQFLSTVSYITASLSGLAVGFASGQYGVSTKPFDGTAAFAAYKTILDILYKVSPRRNFALQYNSVGYYNKYNNIANDGNRQRRIDIGTYLVPGTQSVGDNLLVNNFQRESSVYLKTNNPLPFVYERNPLLEDNSKFVIPSFSTIPRSISSYYATIKNNTSNQYGTIYSYDSIDTGTQINLSTKDVYAYVFGGDCFINRFAYKSKMPFFIDNRVGFPDEADVFYDELNNVGKAKYWFSTDVTRHNTIFGSIFGVHPHRFFWTKSSAFTDNGSIFLFAYGIPYFYCESEVNVDYRQAFNDKEGDFYPRVGTGIPDEWLQEINTTIKQDNTYFYNKTYSKQNKENFFSNIPADYTDSDSRQHLTHSAIWSDEQKEITNYKHNNWLLYKPTSRFDFPKSNGKLISIDEIGNKEVLVRYENSSQLYNAFLSINTSSPKAAYLGNSSLFKGSPPIDYRVGGYNKMMIKTEYGNFICDTKRGALYVIGGKEMKNISGKISMFLKEHLTFDVKKQFNDFPVDNSFKNVGLTGVYDRIHERIIITKRDYKCINPNVKYINNEFVLNNTIINIEDETYFLNTSFTFSYGLDIQGTVAFHSYIPNYYIKDDLNFYIGWNDENSDVWLPKKDNTLFNNFRGKIHPYILEYPFSYKNQDEIVQSVKDYTRVHKYNQDGTYIQTNDVFFNKAILKNEQQCSGVLVLEPKPRHSLGAYMKYPKYSSDSKTIMFTKSDNFYNYNTFWSLLRDNNQPILVASKEPSMFKELNQANMNYSKMSYGKAPIRSKDLRIRHILDNRDDSLLISEFILHFSQTSFK